MKHIFLCSEARSGTTFLLHLLERELLDLGPPGTRFVSLGEALFNPSDASVRKTLSHALGDQAESICIRKRVISEEGKEIEADNEQFDPAVFAQLIQQFYDKENNNGYITVKWFPKHLRQFMGKLVGSPNGKDIPAEEAARHLSRYFGEITYVRLVRQNVYKQAISMYIAQETGVWTLGKRRNKVIPEITYNYRQIKECYDWCAMGNAWWDDFFAKNNITPIAFTYEALIEDYPTVLQEMSRALGVDIYIPQEREIRFQEQSTALNTGFYHRFLDDLKAKAL